MISIILAIIGFLLGYAVEAYAVHALSGREYTRIRYGKWFTAVILAVLFPFIWYMNGNTPLFYTSLILLILLTIVTLTDLMAMLILNKTLLLFTAPIILIRILYPLEAGIVASIIGGCLAFLILAILAIVSNGQIGGGDVKLYALLGFYFGTEAILLHLFLACVFALLITFVFIIFRRKGRTEAISFAPYIALSSLVMICM